MLCLLSSTAHEAYIDLFYNDLYGLKATFKSDPNLIIDKDGTVASFCSIISEKNTEKFLKCSSFTVLGFIMLLIVKINRESFPKCETS